MPQPDMVIFLDASPEVLLSRKQEVGYDSLVQLRHEYLAMSAAGNNHVVADASQSIENVVAEIMHRITR
jgi:thymidylate kinase